MRFNSIEKMCNYYKDEMYEEERKFFSELGDKKYEILDDSMLGMYVYIVRVVKDNKYFGCVGNNGEMRFLEIIDEDEIECIEVSRLLEILEEERSLVKESIKEYENEEDKKLLDSLNRVIEYIRDSKL